MVYSGVGICEKMYTEVYLSCSVDILMSVIILMDQWSNLIAWLIHQATEDKGLVFQEMRNRCAASPHINLAGRGGTSFLEICAAP